LDRLVEAMGENNGGPGVRLRNHHQERSSLLAERRRDAVSVRSRQVLQDVLVRLHHSNVQLVELLGRSFQRCAHHQILGVFGSSRTATTSHKFCSLHKRTMRLMLGAMPGAAARMQM
jgi:hypothetical protein